MLYVILIILGIVLIIYVSRSSKKVKNEIQQEPSWVRERQAREEAEDKLKEERFKKSSNQNIDTAEQLMKLKQLFDDGILNQDEFDKAKSKVLNN